MTADPFAYGEILLGRAISNATAEGCDSMPTRLRVSLEAMALDDSVVIHVPDRQLVEDLMDTDIDALVADVHMPYPVMEITVPAGISISGTEYELSSMMVFDLDVCIPEKYRGELTRQVDVCFNLRRRNDTRPISQMMWVEARWKKDQTVKENLAGEIQASRTPDVSMQGEIKTTNTHTNFVFALMLYFQTVETQNAVMERLQAVHGQWPGFNRGRREQDSRRRHFKVIDITAPKKLAGHDLSSAPHTSPCGHRRRSHLRVLAHAKYKRNPNGSLKSVWVRSTWVGEHNGDTAGQRMMSSVASA